MMLRMDVFDPFMPRFVRYVITPALGERKSVLGLPRLGWLKKFVAVIFIFRRTFSRIGKYLNTPKSTFARPGPTITPGALSPRVPICGMAKAFGLNHSVALALESVGLPTRSGRSYTRA